MDKVLRTICLKKVVANKQGGTKRKLKSRLINKSERMGTNLAVETPTFLSYTVTSTCWFAIMATMQFQLNLNSAILTCYWVQMQHHLHPTSAITTYRILGCLRFPKENQIWTIHYHIKFIQDISLYLHIVDEAVVVVFYLA